MPDILRVNTRPCSGKNRAIPGSEFVVANT